MKNLRDISSAERAILDPAFGDNGILWMHVPDSTRTFARGVTATTDETVFVALEAVFGQHAPPGVGLAKLTPDGAPHPDFGTQGYAVYPHKLAESRAGKPFVLPNGDILLSGSWGPRYTPMLMRFRADGSLDESFADGGAQSFDMKEHELDTADFVPMDDGRILVFGSATHKGIGSTDGIVICLLSNGKFDLSFHRTGMLTLQFRGARGSNAHVGRLVGDRYLLAGGTGREGLIRRYHRDGRIDTSFGVNGEYALPSGDPNLNHANFNDLLVTPEGKLVGLGITGTDRRFSVLVGLDADGHADPGFAGGELVFTPPHLGISNLGRVAYDASGRLIVSGDLAGAGFLLGRYSASGTVDETFADRGYLYIGFGEAHEVSIGFAIQGTRGILLSGQIVHLPEPSMSRAIVLRVPNA